MRTDNLERNNKCIQIIEAAQKRFGLYGLEKTSMREIANDIKLSKASLYYYFPDKESLYKAVVEKEQDEFISKISNLNEIINEPEILLLEFANTRLSYFRTLLNLSRLRLELFSDLKPVFTDTILRFKEREAELVKQIFEKGINEGIFFIDDPDRMASLFLDLLKGLRVTVIKDKVTMVIDQDEYNVLKEKTLAFTEVFIRGISVK